MARLAFERRVVNSLYLRMRSEVGDDLERVLYMTFNAERKRFKPLQEQERVERRESRARISEQDSADIRNVSRCANRSCRCLR